MKLTAWGISDIGLRRSDNEDSFCVAEPLGLFMVADGMGGHAAGEVASAMAIRTVRDELEQQLQKPRSSDELSPLLAASLERANRAIAAAANDDPARSGMGTTLTVLLLHDRQALLAHVGDSRLYCWRDQRLEQLSDDHSLVGDQLRRGIISAQEADDSTLRNVLLQAVGVTPHLDICQLALPVAADDWYLLCSDGLSDMLSQEQISAILARSSHPERGCQELIAAALAVGGNDNITAILVRVDQP